MSNIRTALGILKKIIIGSAKLLRLVVKSLALFLRHLFKDVQKRFHFSITFKITTVYAVLFFRIFLLISLLICASFATYLVKTLEDNISKDFKYIASQLENSPTLPKSNIEQLAAVEDMSVTI